MQHVAQQMLDRAGQSPSADDVDRADSGWFESYPTLNALLVELGAIRGEDNVERIAILRFALGHQRRYLAAQHHDACHAAHELGLPYSATRRSHRREVGMRLVHRFV